MDLLAQSDETLWLFEIKRRKELALKKYFPLGFVQKQRLSRAMLWIWQKERKCFRGFQAKLVIVTERGINWITLPLLYDGS